MLRPGRVDAEFQFAPCGAEERCAMVRRMCPEAEDVEEFLRIMKKTSLY